MSRKPDKVNDGPGGGRFSNANRNIAEEEEIELTSVGVDIGSSTSHLVFSRITMERLGARSQTIEWWASKVGGSGGDSCTDRLPPIGIFLHFFEIFFGVAPGCRFWGPRWCARHNKTAESERSRKAHNF